MNRVEVRFDLTLETDRLLLILGKFFAPVFGPIGYEFCRHCRELVIVLSSHDVNLAIIAKYWPFLYSD